MSLFLNTLVSFDSPICFNMNLGEKECSNFFNISQTLMKSVIPQHDQVLVQFQWKMNVTYDNTLSRFYLLCVICQDLLRFFGQ